MNSTYSTPAGCKAHPVTDLLLAKSLQQISPSGQVLVSASLLHMVLLSGERYLAMKHPFAYITLVTEGRLLIASVLIWLLSVFQRVLSVLDIIL
ncbi:unnamed protein product, partial [Porites lobata]